MDIFQPKSIAIIGASATEGKVGHDILKNLLTQGFEGDIIPVNPKRDEILGMKTYPSITDAPDGVELAVVVIPAKIVPATLEECANKNVRNIVIISAGFGEVHTDEGDALEAEVTKIAAEKNLNIIGPNCLGIIRPSTKMNASFAKEVPPEGSVALISQSGAMAVAVMDASAELGIGYSLIASIGNKAVMDECDLLQIAAEDEKTSVIGFYLESIKDGKRFLKVAAGIAQKKHIVLLKSGVSEHGKKAAASHTGALAGSDAAIDALCSQTGMKRAHSTEEFLDLLEVLSTQPPLLSHKIAVVTNAGGPGILATDATEVFGLSLPTPEDSSVEKLKEVLPAAAATGNPIDVIGDAGSDRYEATLSIIGEDPNMDGLCVILTPQVMTPCEEVAHIIVEWSKKFPLMPVVTCFMGEDSVDEARAILQTSGIPSFETPERAMMALSALQIRNTKYEIRNTNSNDLRATKAAEILKGESGLVAEDKVAELFALYNLPLPKQQLATSAEKAVDIAEEFGYPVVAKISSPTIIHKTDMGGIKVHLENADEVEGAYDKIVENAKGYFKIREEENDTRGVLIQEFLHAGEEFIIGATADPSFGHLVMVGLGGIYTELLKDTAFRIAPTSQESAYEMLQELASWKVLMGMRGKPPLDTEHLTQTLETISQMVIECPQIKDIDLNPVMVTPDAVIIADAKVVL